MDVGFANVYRFKKKIVRKKYWENGLFKKKLVYKKMNASRLLGKREICWVDIFHVHNKNILIDDFLSLIYLMKINGKFTNLKLRNN